MDPFLTGECLADRERFSTRATTRGTSVSRTNGEEDEIVHRTLQAGDES